METAEMAGGQGRCPRGETPGTPLPGEQNIHSHAGIWRQLAFFPQPNSTWLCLLDLRRVEVEQYKKCETEWRKEDWKANFLIYRRWFPLPFIQLSIISEQLVIRSKEIKPHHLTVMTGKWRHSGNLANSCSMHVWTRQSSLPRLSRQTTEILKAWKPQLCSSSACKSLRGPTTPGAVVLYHSYFLEKRHSFRVQPCAFYLVCRGKVEWLNWP